MKRRFIAILPGLLLGLGFFLCAGQTVFASLDPVGYWKFDETSAGVNAADSIGTNVGVPSGNPTPSTDVPDVDFTDTGSMSFNGTNYFTINRPVQDDFTICAWIKTTSTGGGTNHWQSAPIMDSEVGGLANDFGFGIGNGGKLLYGNGGSFDSQVNGVTTINDDVWHNVCAARNGTTGAVNLYVDAKLDATGTTSTGTLNSNSNARIGFGYDGAAHYVGLIDDVRAYNVALTQTQLLSLFQGNNDPDVPPDTTPPVISGITASAAVTTATTTWTTDEAASTKVAYSADTSYASSTNEIDTSPRVTSHSISIPNLLACTLYNYEVVSSDAAGNYATSTSNVITTTGCLGNAVPSAATSTSVTVSSAATSTLSDSGRTLSVSTPVNVTATSSSITIQIKGLDAGSVFDTIGKPSSSLSSAASIVFDVTALINNTTTLDTFDSPVTISYTYTDADVSGLDENSLAMYHYHDGSWLPLNDCSVNTTTNTITCTTPSFSTFAIFGTAKSTSSNSSSSSTTGGSIQSQVANLIAMGKTALAATLKAEWPQLFASSAPITAYNPGGPMIPVVTPSHPVLPLSLTTPDLTLGSTNVFVQALQIYLNKKGFTIAASGAGSSGQETTYFGSLTKAALAKFQAAHGISPASGYFGPVTRAYVSAHP